jgi:hypothetical protein
MNRLRSAFFGLGLLLVASAVQAQDNGVKADIPFDFVVGNQMLPAGEYTIVNQGHVNQAILIRSDEGKTAILSLTQSCSSLNPSAKTKLVFHTMAGRYFLYQIWTQGNSSGRQLPKSKAEVELAKNTDTTGEFVLAARLPAEASGSLIHDMPKRSASPLTPRKKARSNEPFIQDLPSSFLPFISFGRCIGSQIQLP